MSTASAPEYCFVVEDARGDSFEMEILPSDERAKKHFQSVWQRLSLAVEGLHKQESLPVPAWTNWQPWKWCEDKRVEYRPRRKYVAWCASNQVGLLNVWAGFPSKHEAGKQTLYIEHVGAAPGNQDTELWNRKYRYVGTALLAYAVKLSREQSFEGRISLHASDEDALSFYRRVAAKIAGGLFYPEQKDVLGPTPHAGRNDRSLTYLETTLAGADRLLEDYRRA
jgi:hypothetical protein